ncbi:hypothetical protein BD408DRAFT_426025 [Parasitella parasitica]|nr:hypothetical protein BD408DRAFT_426025 [Parasitella parasitica]
MDMNLNYIGLFIQGVLAARIEKEITNGGFDECWSCFYLFLILEYVFLNPC